MSGDGQHDDYRALAEYYDLIYDAIGPDDVPFYLDWAARQSGPVLELGCGTGRVTLPLARAGYSVTALDLSPAMLAVLRGKLEHEPDEVRSRVGLVEGDMAQLDLRSADGTPRHYALIIAPFRAFQHLLETVQQREFLLRVRQHLAPGGVYLHDQFEPNYRYVVENMQRGAVPQLDCTVSLLGGGLLQRHATVRYDLGRQRLDADFRLDIYGADGGLRRSVLERISLRMTHRQEAFYLLELSGLTVEAAYDGYGRTALGPDLARELVLVRRAM